MAIALGYEATGITPTVSRLDALDLAGRNLFTAFEAVERLLEAAEARQFSSEGAYGSGTWSPLSDSYRTWKEAHYPGKLILQREGDLYESLTDQGSPNAVREIGLDYLFFGTSIPYAIYHQEGTDRMPARPPVVLPPFLKGQITRTIRTVLMRKAGIAVSPIGGVE